MPDALTSRQIKLRVVGLPENNKLVLGSVFARELAILIRAIKAADKQSNGKEHFDFVITKLEAASASVTMDETRVAKEIPHQSGIEAFWECAVAVKSGDISVARESMACLKQISAFAHDVDDRFAYAEITINGYEPIIVDQAFKIFAQNAETITTEKSQEYKWFKGRALGVFYGEIQEVDFRKEIPQVIVVTSAGKREIAAECRGMTVDDLRPVLKMKCRIEGYAQYDGTNGLPSHIEIIKIRPTKRDADIIRWEGTFDSFNPSEWGPP